MSDSHMEFNEWFLKEIADYDGDYNKPVYESAKWAWEYKQKELDEKLKRLNDTVDWHIEDCSIVEDTEYNKAWLEAMLFIKHELERSSDPLLSETKNLLSKIVQNNISRIEALQTQMM